MKIKLSLLLCLLTLPMLSQTTVLDDVTKQCHTTWWDYPLKQKILCPPQMINGALSLAAFSYPAYLAYNADTNKQKGFFGKSLDSLGIGLISLGGTFVAVNFLRWLANCSALPEKIAEDLLKKEASQDASQYQTILQKLDSTPEEFVASMIAMYPNLYTGYGEIDFLKASLNQIIDRMDAFKKYKDVQYKPLKATIISTVNRLKAMQKAISITDEFFAGAIAPYKVTYDLIMVETPEDKIINELINLYQKSDYPYLQAENHLESFLNSLNALNLNQYFEPEFESFRARNKPITTLLEKTLSSLRTSAPYRTDKIAKRQAEEIARQANEIARLREDANSNHRQNIFHRELVHRRSNS